MDELVPWAFGFFGALAVVVAAVVVYWRYDWLLRPIGPPASVLLVGGLAILVTDQGRDLGAALLAAPLGQRLWFAAALLFWALATWHSARVPLDRQARFDFVPIDPVWKWLWTWTPRVLGWIVFGFALSHLWLAYRAEDDLGDALILAVLILGMALVYTLFVVFRRGAGRWLQGRLPLAKRLAGLFAEPETKRADLLMSARWSTWLAFAFFFTVAAAITVMAWRDPLAVGARFGSMAIGFVAFGGFLSGLVALWLATDWLRLNLRLAAGLRLSTVIGALLFVAFAVSLTRHYHPVRTCTEADQACRVGSEIDQARPDVASAAVSWFDQARETGLVAPGEPVPMIIVATAGGGSRAAYWTAVVLGQLPEALGLNLETFDRHQFAISGVSGGSVGAAFRTAIRPDHDDAASLDDAVRQALRHDFLAPTLASLAFVDLPSWVLPKLDQTTRGEAMELAFEQAAGARLAAPFLAARPMDGQWRPLLLLNAAHQETGRRVIAGQVRIDRDTFLDSFDLHDLIGIDVPLSTAAHNSARFSYVSPAGRLATHADDANRGWVIDGGYFENFGALTALELANAALAAITEAGHDPGAVLPIVVQISSDPGLGSPVVDADGTSVGRRDLASISEFEACDGSAGPLPYAPVPDQQADRLAGNQILAPLRGVLGSRVAHGVAASKTLARFACGRKAAGLPVAYGHFAMCETAAPPLGWVLSPGAVRGIEGYWETCENPEALAALRAAFPTATD